MRRDAKILKYLGIAVLVAVLVAALAIYWDFHTKVFLNNASAYPLTDVSIAEVERGDGDAVLWTGRLEPGETKWYWGFAPGGGTMRVAFMIDGKKSQVDLGYVSPPVTLGWYLSVHAKDDVKITELIPLWYIAFVVVMSPFWAVGWILERLLS